MHRPNRAPWYALVRLVNDPNATHLYVFTKNLHDGHCVSHHNCPAASVKPQQQFLCTYSHYDCVFRDSTLIERNVFDETLSTANYMVLIVATFDTMVANVDDRNTKKTALSQYQHHEDANIVRQMLDNVGQAMTLSKVNGRNAAVRKVLTTLQQNYLPVAIADNFEQIMDMLLAHLCQNSTSLGKTQAAELATVLLLQRNPEYALHSLERVLWTLGDWEGKAMSAAAKAVCCRTVGTISWLHGIESDFLNFVNRLRRCSRIVRRPAPQSRIANAEWWPLLAAALDALGLMVTMLSAEHLCVLWAERTRPMIP